MPTLFGQAARVKREKGRIRRRLREREEAQLASQQLADEGFFKRFESHGASPGAPEHCQDTFAVERDDSLRPGDFVSCEVCGCSLLFRDAFPVEHAAPDFHRFLSGHPAPRHEDVLPFIIKFYCKLHRLPYDRVSYVYQRGGCYLPVPDGVFHIEAPPDFTATVYCEFFKRTMSDGEYINMKRAHGAAFTPTGPWWQVTEEGEQYD